MDDRKSTLSPLFILVRVLFLIASSGALIKAVFIYGYMFYQSYILALGFDAAIFPLSNSDAYMWAYVASISAGVNLLSGGVGYFVANVFLIGAAVFFLSLLWKSLPTFSTDNQKDKKNEKPKFIIWLREKHPRMFARIRAAVLGKFLERVMSSLMAFQVINICALFILLWVLLPLVGLEHGKQFGEQVIAGYKEALCKKPKNDWDWCVRINQGDDSIKGRLILKNGSLLGIYTSEGPVTVSMPDSFYFKRQKIVPLQ